MQWKKTSWSSTSIQFIEFMNLNAMIFPIINTILMMTWICTGRRPPDPPRASTSPPPPPQSAHQTLCFLASQPGGGKVKIQDLDREIEVLISAVKSENIWCKTLMGLHCDHHHLYPYQSNHITCKVTKPVPLSTSPPSTVRRRQLYSPASSPVRSDNVN